MQTIRVDTPTAKYDVIAGSGLVETLAVRIERVAGKLPQRVFVLTSAPIWALWGHSLLQSFAEAPEVLFLEPGEKHKTMASVERLLRQMAGAGGDRGSLLIAFGGGIVGDVGGFLAAIYMRGIRYVQVPTTFLAQVDSSVGGKTGVNLPEGKNLVGSFHHPLVVFADIGIMGTLPDRAICRSSLSTLAMVLCFSPGSKNSTSGASANDCRRLCPHNAQIGPEVSTKTRRGSLPATRSMRTPSVSTSPLPAITS